MKLKHRLRLWLWHFIQWMNVQDPPPAPPLYEDDAEDARAI